MLGIAAIIALGIVLILMVITGILLWRLPLATWERVLDIPAAPFRLLKHLPEPEQLDAQPVGIKAED